MDEDRDEEALEDRRRKQLIKQPLCVDCLEEGKVIAAEVADFRRGKEPVSLCFAHGFAPWQ